MSKKQKAYAIVTSDGYIWRDFVSSLRRNVIDRFEDECRTCVPPCKTWSHWRRKHGLSIKRISLSVDEDSNDHG